MSGMATSMYTKHKVTGSNVGGKFSKTLSKLSTKKWNPSMTKDLENFQHIASAHDEKEARAREQSLTATFIIHSLDPETGTSCLKPEEIKELLTSYAENESSQGSVGDNTAVNIGPAGMTVTGGGNNAGSGATKTSGTDTQGFDKKSPKGVAASRPAGMTVTGGGNNSGSGATKTSGTDTQGFDKKSPKGVAASWQTDKRVITPEKSAGSPTQKLKREHGQTLPTDTSAVSGSEMSEIKKLAEKRKKELDEKDQEYKDLSAKSEMKDKQLLTLEGNIRELKAQNNITVAEKEDRQKLVLKLEKQLEESNFENTDLQSQNAALLNKNKVLAAEKSKCETELKAVIKDKDQQIKTVNLSLEKAYKDFQRKKDELKEVCDREIRTVNNQLSDVMKERDDLKTRFSKLAGAKLTDQNADIADLSDPNRAMKVSERFGSLYDDEWTDAFEELKKKKVTVKDSIQFLLRVLQDCLKFCNELKETQMHSLNNVLMHPSQDVTKFANEPRKNVGGFKEKPRISSKDEKVVRAVRRQIGVSGTCIEEVKQVFLMETKSWDKQGYDKKQLEMCLPYLQKCAEICWLMVLHDPPLYMKLDAKSGDKMDPNLYTVYSQSGDKIDYLVWPPLFNEFGGGLITKGVAEGLKTIKKK